MEEGFESREDALKAISFLTGITLEEIASLKPQVMLIENILKARWLEVYSFGEISLGVGYWRKGYRKPLFGLWLIEEGKIEQIYKNKLENYLWIRKKLKN